MSDFTVKSDNVDVEQIMRQVRSRIREKRGVDYTEDEIRELASVKLERFLDPKGVRSDLLERRGDRGRLARGDQPDFGEHRRVRLAPADVVAVQSPIEGNRLRERLNPRVRTPVEPPAPGLLAHVAHRV